MAACGNQAKDTFGLQIIDQEPIGLDMAFPEVGIFADQFVRAHVDEEGLLSGQQIDGDRQLAQIFSPFGLPLEVALKAARGNNISHGGGG